MPTPGPTGMPMQGVEGMSAGNGEQQPPGTQLPEGAGGDEADLHTLVPDNLFRQAERPGPLRVALEARAAALNFSVESVFHRMLANCFIRCSATSWHVSMPRHASRMRIPPCLHWEHAGMRTQATLTSREIMLLPDSKHGMPFANTSK